MITTQIESYQTKYFLYKYTQPFNQVVEFCTNMEILKKINFLGLIDRIENTNKKKIFEKDYCMIFTWKNTIKIEFVTTNHIQKQGHFSFSMKLDKINSFRLPLNIFFTINFFENSFDNSTYMFFEIGIGFPPQNNLSNLAISWIINNPYLISKKDFIVINKLLEQYLYSCKKEFSIFESILIKKPVLEIWDKISNIPYLVNIILKIPHHEVKCQGEKGKVGSNFILYNLETGFIINFRIKNAKINKDKIIVYFKKEINGYKAINNKFKVIITEIGSNLSLLQIEHNIPIYCSGIITEKLQNWTKYILNKCKYHLESK